MNVRSLIAGLTVCCAGWALPAQSKPPAIERRDEIAKALEGRWKRIQQLRPRMSVRELFGFALEAGGSNSHLDQIGRVLELAEQMQDRDPTSRTYGNFKWYWNAERPVDRNAVEFCMQQGVLVWMLYRDRLPPAAAERLERLIRFSVEGIRRHRVSEAYTNIFLMKTWNCVAIGEATARPDLAAEGYQMLDRWLIYTFEHGIHEYLSPTYYGVDLDCLGLLAKFARREQTRRDAEAALRLFWTDIAANWFAPAKRLGGAHSRDYDYLTGRGYLNLYTRRIGWADDQKVRASVADQLCFWQPPQDILKLVTRTPRIVHQRWGSRPWERAVHYVGKHFSIGSSGATYGPMDKPLTVNFAGGWRMPQLYFFMDARGDPYGKKRFLMGKSGHSKALHIQPFLASVQSGSEVLLLAHADPADRMFQRRAPEPACLLSHVVFPANVDTWVGEKRVKPAKGERATVPPGTPVFLRFGDVAVGIRFVHATTADGKAAPVALVNDGRYDAMRLTVSHASAAPEAPATVAVWVRGAEGLDEAGFAAFRKRLATASATVKVEGDIHEAIVSGVKGTLRLLANVATRERTVVEGDEPGAEDRLLAVDGRDIGREILGQVAVVQRYQKVLDEAVRGGKGSARAEEVFEAEGALFVVAPFRVDEGEGASGGKFLWMPGKAGEAGPGSAVARALWLVNIPKAGDYTLWARVQAPTPSDDSFFVRIRQGHEEALPRTDWHTGQHPTWAWARVASTSKQTPVTIALKPGVALVEFTCREDGTKLDALFLTADADRQPPH